MTSADPMDPFDVPRLLAGMTTAAAVTAFLTRLTAPLGFPVHVIGALPHPHQPYPERFIHANWPPAWHDAYFNRGFGEHDPVQRAAIMLGSSFSLDDLRKGAIGPLTVRETEVLDFAAALGFPHGFATPVYRDNGYTGLACVVGPGPDPAPRTRALLQFLLMHAHDRLRALSARPDDGSPALTQREIEVLTLARRGLTDAAIAREAGIALRTVRFHFDAIRRKLGARTRAEALARAVAQHLLPA